MAVVAPHPLTNCQPFGVSPMAGCRRTGNRISRIIKVWRGRMRERHAYAQIDEFTLRDLALSRWEVEREIAKPFWRG
jgi:uncharacterized protein YjiS (DUF1127 family)